MRISLGFDWQTYEYYTHKHNDNPYRQSVPLDHNTNDGVNEEFCSAATLSLAEKWLRDVKGWHIQVRINGVRSAYWYEIWSTIPNGPVYGTPDDESFQRGQFDTYEMALSEGIDKVLKLLEE